MKIKSAQNESILLEPYQHFILNSEYMGIRDELVLDLIDISSYIYKADVLTKLRSNGLPRIINLEIPVTNVDTWVSQKKLIEEIVHFLSEDNWNINFTLSPSKLPRYYQQMLFKPKYDSVTLLSGGLDSFCGSYVNINNNNKSLYCGYKINTYETHSQLNIHNLLVKNYKIKSTLFNKIDIKKVTHTQRTRSFLFFSLACACASMYNVNTIFLYENGILSLNPAMESRQTTKTTHPRTIYLINKLFENINLNITIKHPFLFKTKGEIINELSEEFKQYIKYTNTCGISRSNPNIKIKDCHCGACIPCILRKISMSAYDNEKYDDKYNIAYGVKIKDCTNELKAEYKSSNEYFLMLNERISNNTIFAELNIKDKYYNEKNYRELTNNLLIRFGKEIQKYYLKYPLR